MSAVADRTALLRAIDAAPMVEQRGRLTSVVGTTLTVAGVRARVGDSVDVTEPVSGHRIAAEVVGFADDRVVLTPLGDLRGLSRNAEVVLRPRADRVPCGPDLLGRVLDAQLRPLDGGAPVARLPDAPLIADSPNPMHRAPIDRPFTTGVRAVDGLVTLGVGQRLGVFAAAGGGKSTLLAMLARHAEADAIVFALVGERGREVREFIEDALGTDGLARSVVIVATSDRPAMERVRAAQAATAVAEGFRSRGAHVLLLMDSVTRYARALREIGLAAGEPAVRRGFPPSVFAELPRLVERAGTDANGAITALYTVLLEDEDGGDPVGEEVRSLLDGHIHLSRALGARGHYPAIDVGGSLSRLFPRLASGGQAGAAAGVRAMLAKLDEIELLLQMGEYRPGQDRLADVALERRDALDAFLRQDRDDASPLATTMALLRSVGADG